MTAELCGCAAVLGLTPLCRASCGFGAPELSPWEFRVARAGKTGDARHRVGQLVAFTVRQQHAKLSESPFEKICACVSTLQLWIEGRTDAAREVCAFLSHQ